MEFLQRGQAVGADLDLMMEVGKRLDLRVEFSEDAYALLVPGVAAGRFEAAISALSVDDNDLQNARMVTYYSSGSQLAVRPPAKSASAHATSVGARSRFSMAACSTRSSSRNRPTASSSRRNPSAS